MPEKRSSVPAINRQNSENGNKREQILQAAMEKFLEKDFYQVTITEIAARAGVGKGTIYEYFSSKEELFKECFSYCADTYLDTFRAHLAGNSSTRQNLRAIIYEHFKLVSGNRKNLHLLFNERPHNFRELQAWIVDRRREMLQGIAGLLQEGVDLNEIRPDIDLQMAGRLFLALNCIVMGGMIILDDVEPEEKHLEDLFDLYWNGVGAGVQR